MYQQIILIGNLGGDPEMRYTASGVPVTNFSLAVNRQWTGDDGQKHDKTTWFKVSTWRRQAEIVSEYLKKGSRVLVIGEVEEARPYTDRDGNLRASLEVTASSVRFLSSVNGSSGGGSPAQEAASLVKDEDIPF